jgi:hypothetical protein
VNGGDSGGFVATGWGGVVAGGDGRGISHG